jgi:hypothetical protein
MIDLANSFTQQPDPLSIAADIMEKGSQSTVEEFCNVELQEELYSKQREITSSILVNRRTAVKSCHAAGKSYLAARTAAWWIKFHRPGEAFVVSTAPSNDQVKGVLWREINRVHKKGHLPGRVNQTEWWIDDELVAFGRKPQDQDPGSFQGIHARYVLVIIDEACWVPKDLWMAAGSLAANENSRILAIGNPDDPGSYFAEVCKPGTGWHVIRISYRDTPNFSGEPVQPILKELLISEIYVDEMRHEVGEQGAPFISKCEGEFPVEAEDAVVSVSKLMSCMQPEQSHTAKELSPHELGWDVGAGGDKSVVRERMGIKVGRVWYPKGGADTMQQVGNVLNIINQTKATAIKVDTIGIGHGAADRLDELRREGKHSAKVVRVNVSEKSTKPLKYMRLRDEIWWTIGHQMINDGVLDLHGLDDPTVAQLLSPKYQLDSGGRINIEDKKDTKARLGRSPDDADALLLAFYRGFGQGHAFQEVWRKQTAKALGANPSQAPVASDRQMVAHPSPVFSLMKRPRRIPQQMGTRTSCEHRFRGPTVGDTCVFCGTGRQ